MALGKALLGCTCKKPAGGNWRLEKDAARPDESEVVTSGFP